MRRSLSVLGTILLAISAGLAVIPKNVTLTPFIAGTAQAPLNKPIFFKEMPGMPGYYVVLEQHLGRVGVFHRTTPTDPWTKVLMDTVLMPSAVTADNEMGLLGMAFHPNYAQNHKYYLFYIASYNSTSGSRTYIVERKTDSSFIKRDTSQSRILLNITGPYGNHKAGTLDFNPRDGYLYIGVGDGGPATGQDPGNRAQNPDSLLGKFLRIDPDHPANGRQYGIPADNPFVGGGHREEIFALGLRNPFRWSFDPLTGDIWLGHVGQDRWESATLVPRGSNLGWRSLEGNHCNVFYSATCSTTGFTLPFVTYSHTPSNTDSTGNCIIGGYVYRGNPASPFYGVYFYGDNGSRRIWAVRTDGATTQEWAVEGNLTSGSQITSFGTDLQGNLYVVGRGTVNTTATNGTIYALTSPDLVSVSISPRRTGKAFAPRSLRDLSGLDLHNLQGRRIKGSSARSGVYVAKHPGDKTPALVPVLK